jgi:hydrogenase/urease accessory protein HupE
MISLDQITLDRAGDEARVILNVKYPPAIASQSISLIDQLYMHDSSTNYVNLLTIHYGVNTSTAALSGDNRMWAMQLTEEDFASLPEHLDTEQTDNSAATHTGTNSSWQSFLLLGVNHILSGYDHILFLLTLLIARQSLKQYAGLITSFTIAHSITLSLTVLGWIDLSSKIVEPAIALSICYVALDNIFRKQISRRWIITFIFGLIHGMGFADILKEMDIPKSELAVNLISFNVGIEIVQLGIVVILLPILHYLYRWKFAKKAVMGGSSVAFILGAIWLVERILY